MSVTLRKKSLDGGKKSLYLDIYHNNQRYYEFLKIYLIKARTKAQADTNKNQLELAESIRNKREQDLLASEYDYKPAFKRNIDFISYFQKFISNYHNKDLRLVRCSYNYFIEFLKTKGINERINAQAINEDLCKQFRTYLENNLNGETIYNYFTKFKKVLEQAVDENIFKVNPAKKIKNSKSSGIKKDILNINDIQMLAQAKCNNDNIKRAFLFCLNTGLRWVDVKEITWSNIDNTTLKFTQSKTQYSSVNAQVIMELNNNALRLIGERGRPEELIFNLPSHTGALKSLRLWVKNAGLDKHITWHCSRHSFAVNLLRSDIGGADIKTVASLLGHSDLKTTTKYLHVVDELKKTAVNKLPDINY